MLYDFLTDFLSIVSAGPVYVNVKMMNSKTQETLDQLDAHNRPRSRVISRGLADGDAHTYAEADDQTLEHDYIEVIADEPG